MTHDEDLSGPDKERFRRFPSLWDIAWRLRRMVDEFQSCASYDGDEYCPPLEDYVYVTALGVKHDLHLLLWHPLLDDLVDRHELKSCLTAIDVELSIDGDDLDVEDPLQIYEKRAEMISSFDFLSQHFVYPLSKLAGGLICQIRDGKKEATNAIEPDVRRIVFNKKSTARVFDLLTKRSTPQTYENIEGVLSMGPNTVNKALNELDEKDLLKQRKPGAIIKDEFRDVSFGLGEVN